MSLWSRSPRALRFCEMTRLAAATTSLLSSGACTITFCCWCGLSRCALMLSRAATSWAAMFCPTFCKSRGALRWVVRHCYFCPLTHCIFLLFCPKMESKADVLSLKVSFITVLLATFYDEPCWKSITASYQGGFFLIPRTPMSWKCAGLDLPRL
jgi:hypothetical protein